MYYLQSRYYDPETGRFINADDASLLGANGDFASLNLFVYCGNNPIARKDDGGEFWNVVAGAVIGAALGAVSEIASQYLNHVINGEKINWGDVAASAASGAVYGGVMAATGSNTAATIASTATSSVIDGIRSGDSVGEIIVDTARNTAFSALTCYVPKVINKSLSGKYLKLNKVQKWIKNLTSDTYRGRYERGGNYLPDVISAGLEDLGKSVIKGTFNALCCK